MQENSLSINDSMTVVLILFSLFFPTRSIGAENSLQVQQGGIVPFTIMIPPSSQSVSGTFMNRSIPFFKSGKGAFLAIIGIDLSQKPGPHPFVVTWEKNGKTIQRDYVIDVKSGSFKEQRLTLPKGMVDLTPEILIRVRKETGLMKTAFSQGIDERLWRGEFIAPVAGKPQGTFGRRRILNGKPRKAHSGEDITAVSGTPVFATNAGKIALVGHFFFNGRLVVIDHGLGLFSMYFHLLDYSVSQGDHVKRGDQIGRVGSTGRSTGAHLHWGTRLNGAKIDPFSLVGKKLD
ncbi:MAG: peptidoglycan DD-metalloendopeptidase family protein [Nitrospiria bacterium]